MVVLQGLAVVIMILLIIVLLNMFVLGVIDIIMEYFYGDFK